MGYKIVGERKRKPGGGRKPKAFTLLKRRLDAEKADDAEYAFSLYSQVMHDENQSMELRLECADWVSNRVLGKPREKSDVTIHGAIPVQAVDYSKSISAMKPDNTLDE